MNAPLDIITGEGFVDGLHVIMSAKAWNSFVWFMRTSQVDPRVTSDANTRRLYEHWLIAIWPTHNADSST